MGPRQDRRLSRIVRYTLIIPHAPILMMCGYPILVIPHRCILLFYLLYAQGFPPAFSLCTLMSPKATFPT